MNGTHNLGVTKVSAQSISLTSDKESCHVWIIHFRGM